jgi:hypothetical protein
MFEKPFSKRILLAVLLTVLAINIFAQTDPWTQTGSATSISGTWVFRSESLFGTDNAEIELDEVDGMVTGQYSGLLGLQRQVYGKITGDQISLIIEGELPASGAVVQAILTGVLSKTSGSGSLLINQKTAGTWTSRRPKPHEDPESQTEITLDYRSERPGASRQG